jgi:isocitrate lyase
MIIAFTGHRPNKLGSYKLPNPTYIHVCQQIEKVLKELKPEKVISGMAQGTDLWAANIAYKLNIPFIAAVPFIGQEKAWPEKSQKIYHNLLNKATETVIVSEGRYSAYKMQVRSQYMCKHSDKYFPNAFRTYSEIDVAKLKGSFHVEHSLARKGSERLWMLFNNRPYVKALGALTGNQAIQQVKAGLEAIYLSGWQISGDSNLSGEMYPDQSLYPSNSVPNVVKKINSALLRADQIEFSEHYFSERHWLAPIIADAEAGFGGVLNSFELMKSMIESGAAGVHFEDQLSSEKKCGHISNKVLIPTKSFIKHLIAARLAADIADIPTVLIARTDADSASWITSDADQQDFPFIDRNIRSEEGFYKLTGIPMDRCIARGLAYAPYADMLWMETSTPSLFQAKAFAEGIHAKYPNMMLAYNSSPSFNWKMFLSDKEIASFQDELGKMGYKFCFITLAGFHSLNMGMFELANNYVNHGMSGYVELQEKEFSWQNKGYTAVKHQAFVGTAYFDKVRSIIDGNDSNSALTDSTEKKQF